MKKLLPLLLCSLPFFCLSQTLDSTIVKQVDSLIAVSNSLWRAKKHADAEPIALQAKELTLKKLGSENATYAACLHNLGGLHYSWGGEDYNKCIVYWEEALALRERVLSKLHPDYGKTLNNMGKYYMGLDNTKSEKIILEALELKGITSGKESIEYSKALYSLAVLYRIMNKPDEALDASQKCFAIREKLSAPGSGDYGDAINVLANVYFTVGRYEEASALYNKLLEITNKNDSRHITGLCNLAALYNQMGKYEDAELLSFQAIESLEKNGEEGDLMVLSLQNYGNSCAYLGRIDEAIATHEKSLLVKNISENERARASLNLGILALHTYKNDEAERYLLSAKNQYDKLYGKEHYEQYHITNNLGGLYNLTDRFEEAESLFREAIRISEKLEPGGEKSSVPIINIGMMYLRQGQYLMAEEYLLRALELRQKRMGQKSPKVEEALSYLQQLYLVVNKLDKAIPIALLSDSLRQAMIKRASGYLTDREMAALLGLHAHKNEVLLSIATLTHDPKMKDAAYNNALFYKGFSLEGNLLLERAFRQADETDADLYLQWKGLQRRLANEYAKP
jgi:tetratricopeptide (TPR) repeat protein